MAISINQLESGIGLQIDGNIWLVQEYQHVKPGKGSAFVRVKLRNLTTDQVLERTYRSAETLQDVELEERRLQNLYTSGDEVHFMDHTTYEETTVPKELMGDGLKFLQENLEVTAICHNNKVLKVILPNFIITEVTQSETGLKGDSSKAGTKPAVIDTGALVQVPLFINQGDWIKLDTRTGTYVERVQK